MCWSEKEHITVNQLKEISIGKLADLVDIDEFYEYQEMLCLRSVKIQCDTYEKMAKFLNVKQIMTIMVERHGLKITKDISSNKWIIHIGVKEE